MSDIRRVLGTDKVKVVVINTKSSVWSPEKEYGLDIDGDIYLTIKAIDYCTIDNSCAKQNEYYLLHTAFNNIHAIKKRYKAIKEINKEIKELEDENVFKCNTKHDEISKILKEDY